MFPLTFLDLFVVEEKGEEVPEMLEAPEPESDLQQQPIDEDGEYSEELGLGFPAV